MDVNCGCKGVRFCVQCKDSERIRKLRETPDEQNQKLLNYSIYVYKHGKCFKASQLKLESSVTDIQEAMDNVEEDSEAFEINGINLLFDFLSEEEEERLVKEIDMKEWALSQSGRRKQVSLLY